MGKRRWARELALQMLYQQELGGSRLEDVIASFKPAEVDQETGEKNRVRAADREQAEQYARRVAEGVLEHRAEIDELIQRSATNWRLERMSAVDRTILRAAVYELLFEDDVPQIVVVDEAIELAKRFGSEQSAAFVNGVLDGLLQTADFPGTLA